MSEDIIIENIINLLLRQSSVAHCRVVVDEPGWLTTYLGVIVLNQTVESAVLVCFIRTVGFTLGSLVLFKISCFCDLDPVCVENISKISWNM